MKLFLYILLLVFITGCSEKELKITKAGEYVFRRSYAAIQFRDVSDSELDSIEKSNPWPCDFDNLNKSDSLLRLHLYKNGFLDNNFHLKRSKFPETVPLQFTLTNQQKKELQVSIIDRIPGEITNTFNLVLSNKEQRIIYELESHYGGTSRDISYQIVDLIPGGYPEIVVLNEYYIMNGDNSDIYIYEVTK